MSQEFNTVISYVEKMESRYFLALSAFYAYKGLTEQLVANLVGQEVADENVKVFQTFNEILGPSMEALRVYFFMELAKLFDLSEESLHVTKIMNYAQSNISKLIVSDFAEYGQNREFISRLIEDYKGVTQHDLSALKLEMEKHKEIIERVKTYRDKYLAHDDIKKSEINITGEEIIVLFDLLEKILNMFSSKLISTTSIYDHVEMRAKDQANALIDHLKRFEPYRIQEIKQEVEKEMKNTS